MEPELDWLTLDDDEEVVWSDTPHPASIVPALVVGLPLSLVLVGIPIVASAYLSLRNTHYVVTTSGLYRKSGILSRDVQKVGFDKVQNTSYSQGILGSYVGFGNVDISTAGGSGIEMRFGSVENPREVAELVNRRVKRSTGTGEEDTDKAAVLDEVVTELRAIRSLLEADGPARGETPMGGDSEGDDRVETTPIDELVTESPDEGKENPSAGGEEFDLTGGGDDDPSPDSER
ncbi:PH domain-containing protein [Halogeometricum sp. S1BR25-6]|uniref:PH domain-containing protein n=1 Tax=Halogeometricum salsisoli TaxID=2950536 RepID=A0ABU2GDA1_9EURY|nr:PH domain-containing protein [Halogeometricum sp. S1BR25-6]MDS0298772.1 PH domain-containing protein [Halogeometricum sp. S1BR25-6]